MVEDEPDWRLIAGGYLEESGYQVVTARNGPEALLEIDRARVDAVLLDVNLGGEDGAALISVLKSGHPNLPVILYTGMRHDHSEIEAMLKKGAQLYLRKRTMQDLLHGVRSVLN
jgi:DNA-binding response OmpR family regulator